MKILIPIILICSPLYLFGQPLPDSLSLEEVYLRIETSYPLMDKTQIQKRITELNDHIARSGLFPEVEVHAGASYQSEVTEVPFAAPGTTPPELSKDHYNISVDVSQSLYDGGLTNARRMLQAGQSSVEDAGVEAEMWKVRSQAEQVYFGILNLQKQKESVELLIGDIEEQLSSVQARIENGVLLPGNGLVMEAELLKVQQQNIQLNYDILAAFEVLSELTGEEISPQTTLQIPEISAEFLFDTEISRPELQVFEERVNTLNLQQRLTSSERLPKVSAFAKGAYGRPGFNVFDDDPHPYWMVGVRAQWSFRSWNNAGKNAEVLELQKNKIRADEEAFLRGIGSELSRTERRIQQLEEQVILDEKVMGLREQVVKEKNNQLNEGIITSTEYLTELHAEARARVNLELRKLQLIRSRIEYLTNKGISWI